MKNFANFALLLIILGTFAGPALAQVYGYNVQVVLKGDYSHQGKLKLYYEGDNFSHKVVLSPKTETLRAGTYNYVSSAPYPIEQIKSVLLDWSKKPFNLMYKVQVDKIVLSPGYIQDSAARQGLTRGYCSGTRPQTVQAGKAVKFWMAC